MSSSTFRNRHRPKYSSENVEVRTSKTIKIAQILEDADTEENEKDMLVQDTTTDKTVLFPLDDGLHLDPKDFMDRLKIVGESLIENGHGVTWDPMDDDFYGRTESLGVNLTLTEVQNVEDIVCKFNDGSGQCWKGPTCPYKHVKDETRPENSSHVFCAALCTLPESPVGLVGMSVPAVVTHVDSPWSIYVVPLENWDCVSCSDTMKLNYSNKREVKLSQGLKKLNKLEMDLSYELTRTPPQHQTEYFAVTELVGVRCYDKDTRAFAWKRGVILRQTDNNVYYVKLIDSGYEGSWPRVYLVPLPKTYTQLPQFAFNCGVHGVCPLYGKNWSPRASSKLQDLLMYQEVVLEVQQLETCDSPFLVKMTVFGNDKQSMTDVAEFLCSEGFAKKSSPSTPAPTKKPMFAFHD